MQEKVTNFPACQNKQIEWDYRFCPICGAEVKEKALTEEPSEEVIMTCKSCSHFINTECCQAYCDLGSIICHTITVACDKFHLNEKAPAGRPSKQGAREINQVQDTLKTGLCQGGTDYVV